MKPKSTFIYFINLLILLSGSYSYTLAQEDNSIFIQRLVNKIDSIKTYHVNLTTKIYPPVISDLNPDASEQFDTTQSITVNTTVVGESGRRMNIKTILGSPEVDPQIDLNLIYDGKWLWVEQKVRKHPKVKSGETITSAMKVHIPSVSPDPEKEPFNTIYGVTGTGLFRYRDLPGTLKEIITLYRLSDIYKPEDSDKIILSGFVNESKDANLKKSQSRERDDDLKSFIKNSTRFCKIWVSKESNLIMAYSFGVSDKASSMHVTIDYLNINEKLPDDIFVYKPQKGIVVRDETTNILQKMKQVGKQ